MIKRILKKFQKRPATVQAERQVIRAKDHQLNARDISDAACKTIHTLQDHGFEAYLVGGGVRDLLLDLHPKDFDVATNATPEQVVKLFRRAMIIGRRFKIAHVRFGADLIEVTTFRGHHHDQAHHKTAQRSHSGMLLRDNVFGSMEEDALRRDFTVNALYYDLDDNCIIDFANGMRDLNQRQIRIIGDPEQRYREDPVRMLRAIRLAAKLDFMIETQTAAQIMPLRHLLENIAPARLFDEILKLFTNGYGLSTLRLLHEYRLLEILFPQTSALLAADDRHLSFLEQAMANTDDRVHSGKRTSPAYLFAAFLWPAFQHELQQQLSQAHAPAAHQAQHLAADRVIQDIVRHISIPRRFSAPMKEIWQLQFRLDNRRGKRAQALFNHPRFRAAYDFLLLREQNGEALNDLGQWWTDYQDADDHKRDIMANAVELPDYARKKKPRRRSGKRRSPPPTVS